MPALSSQISTPSFDGQTFDPSQDAKRLASQLERVKGLMLDGQKRTLHQIQERVGGTEAAISARLRDLRKSRLGGYRVTRERGSNGLHWYRLQPPIPSEQLAMRF